MAAAEVMFDALREIEAGLRSAGHSTATPSSAAAGPATTARSDAKCGRPSPRPCLRYQFNRLPSLPFELGRKRSVGLPIVLHGAILPRKRIHE
jgi:hypothetical protein